MKKSLLLLIILFTSYQLKGQSCPSTGGTIIDNDTDYNCNQYVRAALIEGIVNMSTGIPTQNIDGKNCVSPDISCAAIKTSDDFIEVASTNYAQALSINGVADHSVLVLNGGFYGSTIGDFASTPGVGSKTYKHGHVAFSTGHCGYNMYATTKDFSITGPSAVLENQTAVYTLNDASSNNLMSQITNVEWVVDGSYLTIQSSTSTTVTVKGTTPSGSYTPYIRAKLKTSAITGSDHVPTIERTISVQTNCTGTLNGGSLYTFNTISANTNYNIIMNQGSYNWNKTSGTTNYWYASNSNKELDFSVPSGCATFTATRSGCSLSFTFCAYGGYSSPNPPLLKEATTSMSIQYSIMDLSTCELVKTGFTENGNAAKLTDGLPKGTYVLNMNGQRKTVSILK